MQLALLIASLLSATVQGVPQIPATIKNIMGGIFGGLSAVIDSGVTHNLSPVTVLGALAGVIQSIKNIQGVPTATLNIIAGLDDAITAALAADQEAQQKVDTTQLTPVQPLP